MSLNNNTPNPPVKKSAVPTIFVVSLVILALAGAAVWYLFFRGGSDTDERAAYDNIMRYENAHQLDSLGEALNEYFDTYNSDAFHYSQLKELHDRFFTERDDWQAAEDQMSLDAVRHFLDVHPDGFYLGKANQKFDSLSYVHAVETNTREVYEQYLSQFSHGKYVAEVRKLMLEIDNEELTIEEKASVKETLTAHSMLWVTTTKVPLLQRLLMKSILILARLIRNWKTSMPICPTCTRLVARLFST